MLAQGGRCRQLDTSAASLARPLVELVPPTGEEQTVELQVHLPSRTLTLTLPLALTLTLALTRTRTLTVTLPRCTSGAASLAASHPHAPRSGARPRPNPTNTAPKPTNTARPPPRASRRVPAAPKPTDLLLARSPAYNRQEASSTAGRGSPSRVAAGAQLPLALVS